MAEQQTLGGNFTSQAEEISEKYTYVLCVKNEKRGMTYDDKNNPRADPEYPTQRNLLLRSSVIWPREYDAKGVPTTKGKKDPFTGKERNPGKYLIRYYDGCTTLFVDDQPKEKETIEQLMRSTRELIFSYGYIHIPGYDTMLKTYMDWCSWNEFSEYRVPTINPIFKKLDTDAEHAMEATSIDDIEKALEFAKNANEKDMIIHAKFMDVPTVDYVTGKLLSTNSLRVEYRKAAMKNTKRFLQTVNNKTMHVKYWIEKAIESGEISTSVLPNKASWGKKGRIICDISGLTTPEVILNKLIEFSQTDEGAEFKQQLESLFG